MTTKVDRNLGKQKFKAKRQYTITVEFEGEAFTKDDFESLLHIELELKEHNEYGKSFINATKTIKEIMPLVHVSGGVSNHAWTSSFSK